MGRRASRTRFSRQREQKMTHPSTDPQTIVDFWREAGPQRWFEKDDAFDETIRQRYGDLYEMAARGDLDHWADDANGALALIILLDQFPRNMFRGTPLAFATDAKALDRAAGAVAWRSRSRGRRREPVSRHASHAFRDPC